MRSEGRDGRADIHVHVDFDERPSAVSSLSICHCSGRNKKDATDLLHVRLGCGRGEREDWQMNVNVNVGEREGRVDSCEPFFFLRNEGSSHIVLLWSGDFGK